MGKGLSLFPSLSRPFTSVSCASSSWACQASRVFFVSLKLLAPIISGPLFQSTPRPCMTEIYLQFLCAHYRLPAPVNKEGSCGECEALSECTGCTVEMKKEQLDLQKDKCYTFRFFIVILAAHLLQSSVTFAWLSCRVNTPGLPGSSSLQSQDRPDTGVP